jgi:Mg-chelatase subunit ChlD
MSFSSPLWLLALLALPLLVVVTVRTLRGHGGRLSPARRRAFLVLRSLAVLLLVLACAGMGLRRVTDRLSLVFLLDQSDSVTAEQRAAGMSIIDAVRSRLRPEDSASLVRFGADAVAEDLPRGAAVPSEGADAGAGATDIAKAIQLGLAEAKDAPRIVLLTDGNENRGDAERAATVARSQGVPIFAFPLGATGTGTEVEIANIRAPARVRQGEPHEVTVMVRSRTPVKARVTLLRDGQPVATREGALSAGENAVQFSGAFPERGLHAWDAFVDAPADAIPQNNRYRRYVEVSGAPQVLYVSRPGRQSTALLGALAAQGITVIPRDVAGLPGTLPGYLPYDAVLLDNVPGYGISNEKMEVIARYVRDVGGGLAMLGGDSSFGAGGYYKTAIERVLPVDMDVKTPVNLPRLSLVILVDKSGSMGGTVASGETKLDVVKSAALSAIETLNPFDKAGLLAFDADWEWTVPLMDAGNTDAIAADLSTLVPGGGTSLAPALEEAERVLVSSPSPLRHVIVLTDGLTNPGDFSTLVRRMAGERVTVSTVAVGEDADAALLRDIAEWGGGRTYATNDPHDVPKIFLDETSIATRGLLVEKSFFPREVSAAESMRGISLEGMPALSGFVLTYMKPGAEMALSALYDAPLLATWRYGLGKTAAFTSDFRAHWGTAWLEWGQFPRLAAQLVRWIERPSDATALHPRIDIASGIAHIAVDAYDSLGAFIDGLAMKAIVLGPDGGRLEIPVPQTAPGFYEARVPAGSVGDYTITLDAHRAERSLAPLTFGVSIPYSEEYAMLGVDRALLGRIAAETQGAMISGPDDEQSLSRLLRRRPVGSATESGSWRLLLVLALVAFFLDVVVRRVSLPQGFRLRVSARMAALRQGKGPSYEELSGMVARAKDAETVALRHRVSGVPADNGVDPEIAAYLYIARMRSRKAEEEKKR